jgi:hypothetical protein
MRKQVRELVRSAELILQQRPVQARTELATLARLSLIRQLHLGGQVLAAWREEGTNGNQEDYARFKLTCAASTQAMDRLKESFACDVDEDEDAMNGRR